jgi:hypothetical protein
MAINENTTCGITERERERVDCGSVLKLGGERERGRAEESGAQDDGKVLIGHPRHSAILFHN